MKISELWVYPIKSCAGIQLREASVESSGFRFDRQWMIVSAEGKFLTQRQRPELAQVRTKLLENQVQVEILGASFSLQGPGEQRLSTEVWSQGVQARLEKNQEVATALSDFLKMKVQLVTRGPEFKRAVKNRTDSEKAQVLFADSAPFLFTTTESLSELNSWMKEAIPMSRFRPNVVLEGAAAPFIEDEWEEFRAKDVAFRFLKKCSRCPMILVDQASGVKKSNEPLLVLGQKRREENKVNFGVLAWPLQTGWIKQGETLSVLQSKELKL